MAPLLHAFMAFRRGKGGTSTVRDFEANLAENLVALAEELAAGTWTPGRSICFAITRPKPREVLAALARDRVVHHLVYAHIAPAIERTFIADSSACIPGRGTHYAVRRLQEKVRSITRNGTRRAFYLKCDIANFFVSIDKRRLDERLGELIHEPFWRDLARTILFHDPRDDVELQGAPSALGAIPPHKSLFNQPAGFGLPIGNLPSQFFANVLLDILDKFVKHQLRAPHYGRYVDDLYLLSESPQQLNSWLAEISAFLPARLGLRLNPSKTVLQPIDRGIDFCGMIVRPHHTIMRRRTLNDALRRLQQMPVEDVPQAANSYLGLCRQATHSHRDRARIANLVRRRGLAVDHRLTKVYP